MNLPRSLVLGVVGMVAALIGLAQPAIGGMGVVLPSAAAYTYDTGAHDGSKMYGASERGPSASYDLPTTYDDSVELRPRDRWARLKAVTPGATTVHTTRSQLAPIADATSMTGAPVHLIDDDRWSLRHSRLAANAGTRSVDNLLRPGGLTIGKAGTDDTIREITGGLPEAQTVFQQLTQGGTLVARTPQLTRVELPNGGGFVQLRTVMSRSPNTAATIDVNIPGFDIRKLKYNLCN